MKIAILGSGLMGAGLGRIWAKAGHHIIFTYSRSNAKLERLAQETGGTAASVADAVKGADAILLAVNWSSIDDVLEQAGELAGKVVLNCSVPLDDANDSLVLGPRTSGAEELARMRPRALWVSCFNTSPSESFAPVYAQKGQGTPPDLLMYGDAPQAKTVAKQLITDAGFSPLEAGGLKTGRYAEPFAMVTAVLAYGQPGGPALTYNFKKL